ncbi:MAG: asparagine synthase (glutamine-hydrolyzing), partial [Gammaproteobacteria bacterium]|nr:asparagine synthase (glutamine-hydrolyzing) [Gammaproteobacteria bacterium]
MCGIAGVLQTGAPVERDLLTGLCARLAHRGPDAEGIFQDGALGLAHTRLSIIDVRGGDQPLTNADGSVVVVANGEIYNHVEVREQLEARGHRFRTQSDCECLVHAWREWGDDFLDHLSGMFAFALWDRRDRCLLLARDRLGIKPLFVYQTAERIAFASELKALRPLLATEPEIDATGLAQYLNAQYTTGRTTLLAGVTRVLPGELWRIDSSLGVQRRRYWDLRDVSPSPMSAAEANEAFESLMQTVMREHMRTDVPFGLFLSGGLDSSSLLALLSELDTDPVRALSLGFSGHADHDESAQARTLAQAFTPRHTVLEVDRDAMFGSLPTSIWAADELMLDYASLPTLALARRAGAELKVVFTGEGGDEVFAGYGRYRMSAPERAVRALLHPGSGGFRTRGAFRGAWPGRLFRPPLSQALPCWREPVRELWNAARDDWSAVQKMQYVDLCTALPDNLL